MLGHYLVVAIRNLARQRLHSALSILVLALGLTCFLAASLFALYLDSFERGFAKRDRTYVLYQSGSWPQIGYHAALGHRSGIGLRDRLAIEIPELEAVARQVVFSVSVSAGGRASYNQVRGVAPTDAAWADIFDMRVVAGDARETLLRHKAAILTRKSATDIFGATDVIGRTLTMTGQTGTTDVTIGAVIEDFEGPSHLAAGAISSGVDVLLSWDVLEALVPGTDRYPVVFAAGTTYLLLPADGSLGPQALNDRLELFASRRLPATVKLEGATIHLEARRVSTIGADDFQKRFEGLQFGTPLPFKVADLAKALAALVLAIGCLNFVNLMTVRSMGRAREIGVRKAVGAARLQIVRQDLFQTAFVVSIGLVLALLVFAVLVRVSQRQWRLIFDVPWTRPAVWILLAAVLVGVTLAAGLYPACVLARVQPVEALRLGTMRSGPRFLRSVLVVVQVGASALLAIVLLTMLRQGDALRTALLGRFDEQYVLVLWPLSAPRQYGQTISDELARSPAILGVTASEGSPVTLVPLLGTKLSRTVVDQSAPSTYELTRVAHDYFSVMRVPLLAGRGFSREYSDGDSPTSQPTPAGPSEAPVHAIIDRRAARSLGWENPADAVGQIVYTGSPRPVEVIGVVDSVPGSVLSHQSDGQLYLLSPQNASVSIVKVAPGKTEAALAHIDNVGKRFAPNAAVQRQFLDEAFASAYENFTLAIRVLAGLAIFGGAIAAVGLFGLAAYVTRRRTREIGVRKSHGASTARISRELLWEFAKPALLGNVVAWPFAIVAARMYVGLFSERPAMTPAPFLIVLGASLLIALGAVGANVWAASRVNPAVALRED